MGDCSSVAADPQSRLDLISRPILVVCWLSVDSELAIGQYRLGVHGTCGLINPWHHLRKMSSWVGNPGRPPYVIPRGSAGLKKGDIAHWLYANNHITRGWFVRAEILPIVLFEKKGRKFELITHVFLVTLSNCTQNVSISFFLLVL